MTESLLQLPDFLRAQYAREGRVLPQSPALFVVRTQEAADLLQRAFQNPLPFLVALKQGRGAGVQTRPAVKIVAGDAEQVRLLLQSRGHTATHLKADLVC